MLISASYVNDTESVLTDYLYTTKIVQELTNNLRWIEGLNSESEDFGFEPYHTFNRPEIPNLITRLQAA